MPLLLDIGNTHTRIAHCGEDGVIVLDEVVPTCELKDLHIAEHGQVALCSVVPEVLKYFRDVRGVFILEAASYHGRLPLLADASTLGSDRLANAVALFANGKFPVVSVDCGTAVTLEFVHEKGFAGGAIFPGRKLQRNALAGGTAQLKMYPLATEKPVAAGTNTADAVASGVDLGSVGAVERIIADWELEGGCRWECECVITGGDARFFAGAMKRKNVIDPLLTLRGVFEAWRELCV